jgi:nucleoside-diphosphate-sugar epimerase
MMKVCVIGGSGFVGTRLIDLLKGLPDVEVLNLDKKNSDRFPQMTKTVDILDLDSLSMLMAGSDVIVLLAAEHKDNVSPVSLYYDVNVSGTRNTLIAMERNGIKRLIFTSSVAVYGLNKHNASEKSHADPFNDYGKSKWQAETILKSWYEAHLDWNINIVRPTVIFGEGNRGNVYNLLHQIASGKFMMIGRGDNRKSMAYVGNVASFLFFQIAYVKSGYNVFNYVDKPDLTMNELVDQVSVVLKKQLPKSHFPYWLGMCGGYCFDVLSMLTKRKMTISSVRVKKFCAVTQFDATKAMSSGFKPIFTLEEGLSNTLIYEFEMRQN